MPYSARQILQARWQALQRPRSCPRAQRGPAQFQQHGQRGGVKALKALASTATLARWLGAQRLPASQPGSLSRCRAASWRAGAACQPLAGFAGVLDRPRWICCARSSVAIRPSMPLALISWRKLAAVGLHQPDTQHIEVINLPAGAHTRCFFQPVVQLDRVATALDHGAHNHFLVFRRGTQRLDAEASGFWPGSWHRRRCAPAGS